MRSRAKRSYPLHGKVSAVPLRTICTCTRWLLGRGDQETTLSSLLSGDVIRPLRKDVDDDPGFEVDFVAGACAHLNSMNPCVKAEDSSCDTRDSVHGRRRALPRCPAGVAAGSGACSIPLAAAATKAAGARGPLPPCWGAWGRSTPRRARVSAPPLGQRIASVQHRAKATFCKGPGPELAAPASLLGVEGCIGRALTCTAA